RSRHLKITRDGLEVAHHRARRLAAPVCHNVEAVIHVVMDQLAFCFRNRLLNSVKLLGKLKACAAFLEHRYDASDVPRGPLESLDDSRMDFVDVRFRLHFDLSYPMGGDTPSVCPGRQWRIATFLRAQTYPIPLDTMSTMSVLHRTMFRVF